MTEVLLSVHGVIWGIPTLVLILGVGILITLKTGFVQFRQFPAAMRDFCRMLRRADDGGKGISSFRALCTALGATAGTGNIIGVAGAITLGGPGAIFWMWISGLLGMATKFAEVTLAVRWRRTCAGEYVGGPMYMITDGMPGRWKWLAVCYSIFGIVAAFGVGNMVQINGIISGINGLLTGEGSFRRDLAFGLLMAVVVGAVLLGGVKQIGVVAEGIVPGVSLLYILLCIVVLIRRAPWIPDAFLSIFQGAFSPEGMTGGAVGSAFQALRIGCARGVFTNEAGMGTASIAHACADTPHPVRQGLMGLMEVFLDTIVLCSLTALVILVSGVPIPYGMDGAMVTMEAFAWVCGSWVKIPLTVCLCCLAAATVFGWGLYGARCAQFLFGRDVWQSFALAQTGAVIAGAVLKSETVWLLAELVNGLMAIPNLISLAALSPELVRLTKEYIKTTGGFAADGGNYADLNQRKSLRTFSHAKVSSLRHGSREAG